MNWHQKIAKKEFFAVDKNCFYGFFASLLIMLCLFASWHMRAWQYDQWEKNPNQYYASGSPSFSTTDAAYFVKKAIEIKKSGNSQKYSEKRNYPDNLKIEKKNEIEAFSVRSEPFLSVLISYIAKDASKEANIDVAHKILLFCIVLTSVGVVLAFGAAGYWYEGCIAALGSSLSSAFLGRTSAGRIDTDQLNLGFFYFITALLIWASRCKNLLISVLLCVLAALTAQLFQWWWPKPILNWAFVFCLAWLGICLHQNIKRTTILLVLFVFFSGSFSFSDLQTVEMVAQKSVGVGKLSFPNTYDFVTELASIPIYDLLTSISGNLIIASIAILGFCLWVLVSPTFAFVFLPALFLGLANFIFGNRVVFFASPILWFGFAFFGILVLRSLTSQIKMVETVFSKNASSITHGVSAICIFSFTYFASFNPLTNQYVPNAVFSKEVTQGFQTLGVYQKENKGLKPAVIATWWDYGYMAHLHSDLPTLNDGGSQRTPKTHFIARSLISDEQSVSGKILKFISTPEWTSVVENATSKSLLEREIGSASTQSSTDIYLYLTEDMVRWMAPISGLAFWDTDNGRPLNVYRGSNRLRYLDLKCDGAGFSFHCNGQHYDLHKGTIDGKKLLSRVIQTNNGAIVKEVKYNLDEGPILQFNQLDGRPLNNQLVHPKLYKSTFHELFYLGQYDPKAFEPVINGFPYYRVYKVL